jgi:hypothetical protein
LTGRSEAERSDPKYSEQMVKFFLEAELMRLLHEISGQEEQPEAATIAGASSKYLGQG